MPAYEKHINQANHNINMLDDTALDSTYNDWKVTIVFYAAVHFVEARLARYDWHTESHKLRFEYINRIKDFQPIASIYQVLYMSSIKSRYKCSQFSDQDVGVLKQKLL